MGMWSKWVFVVLFLSLCVCCVRGQEEQNPAEAEEWGEDEYVFEEESGEQDVPSGSPSELPNQGSRLLNEELLHMQQAVTVLQEALDAAAVELAEVDQSMAEERLQDLQSARDAIARSLAELVSAKNISDWEWRSRNGLLREQMQDNRLLQQKMRMAEQKKSRVGVDYESGRVLGDNGTLLVEEQDVLYEGQNLAENQQQVEQMVEDMLSKSHDPALLLEDATFILNLAVLLTAATVGGAVASIFRAPIFVGFIVGGLCVGPSGTEWITQPRPVETLSSVGMALILFMQGLDFQTDIIGKFKLVWTGMLSTQMLIAAPLFVVLLTYSQLDSWTFPEIILLVVCAFISSSHVALDMANHYHPGSLAEELLTAVFLAQDLFLGFLLCIPSALRLGMWGIFVVIRQIGVIVIIGAFFLKITVHVLPQLANFLLSKDRPPQLFMLSLVSLCLVAASFTRNLGLSLEFGAFFAGLTLSKTSYAQEARTRVESVKDVFSPLLFASVGMLISPGFIRGHAHAIVVLSSLAAAVKGVMGFVTCKCLGFSNPTSAYTAVSLAHIGEFSMVLAGKGYALGFIPRHHYLIFITTSVTTLVLAPLCSKICRWYYPPSLLPRGMLLPSQKRHTHGHGYHSRVPSRDAAQPSPLSLPSASPRAGHTHSRVHRRTPSSQIHKTEEAVFSFRENVSHNSVTSESGVLSWLFNSLGNMHGLTQSHHPPPTSDKSHTPSSSV